MRLPFPEDRFRRGLTVAIVCSILLHVLLLGSVVWVPRLSPLSHAKRGEALFVDMAPDKPEDKAPLGNPSRPPGPPPSPEPAVKAPTPPTPRPKIAAPSPGPAPAPRPAREPSKQVAKVPAPEPPAKSPPEPPAKSPPEPPVPAAEPALAAPSPQQTVPREPDPARVPPPTAAEMARSQVPASGSARSEPSDTQTALARPRPNSPAARIFRHPGGGGGLQGGRGGTAGEPVPLDTPDPNYREYMLKVRQRIYAKWGYPYEAQTRGLQGKLIIEFHIGKDGRLQFIELKQSSGEDVLDSFAMTAVKLAQVYDPLPDAMKRDLLPIVAVFVYTLRGPLSVLQSVQ